MKNLFKNKLVSTLLIVIFVFSFTINTPTTFAATAQWDSTIGTAGIQDGAGTWNTVLLNWIKAGINAVFVAGDDVIFGGGASGTAGAVNLTGPISVNSLTFNNPFAGNYSITGSTLTLGGTGSINAVNNTTISSILAGTVGLNKTGVGNLSLPATNTYTGNTTVAAGSLIIGTGGTGRLGNNSGTTVNAGAVLTFNTTSYNATNFTGSFSGAGTITVNGPSATAQVQYAGNATAFTGTFDISAGSRLNPAGVNAFSQNAAYVINGSLITLLTGNNLKLGSLSGSGNILGGGGSTGSNTFEIGNLNTNTTFSGTIVAGAGHTIGVKKVGTGTQLFNGTNTYAGSTDITAGILGGTGSVAASANTIVRPAATIMGGTGAGNTGIFTTGVLNFNAGGAKLRVNTNGTNAVSKITSDVTTLNGATVDVLGAMTTSGTYDLITGTAVTGTAVLGTNSTGCAASLLVTATKLQLVLDCVPPTATINQAVGQGDPTGANPINFTVVFSEAINPASFTAADIVLTGTGTGTVGTPTTADNITWTVPVTGTAVGTIIADIPISAVTDVAGNANAVAATFTDHTVTYANAGITTGPNGAGITILETGAGTISVVLNTQPASNVVLDITSSDTGAATVSPAQMTFTSANWNTAQNITVTGVTDADLANESVTVTVTVNDALSSNEYDPLANLTEPITVTDTNVAGYTVTPLTRTVAENGGTATYTVVLTAQPATNVVISNTSSATGEVTVAPATLTFTNANWNTAQVVTITGVNDNIDTATNDTANIVVSIVDASSDNAWDPLADQTVVVTATDDDTAGFTIVTTDNLTGEDLATGSFTIVMNSQPTANTTVALSSSNTAEGTVQASVTFTTANWNTPQTITVQGVDDVVPTSDGTVAYTIVTGAVTSTDPIYGAMNGSTIADPAMQNTNNDAPGIVVTVVDGSTDEAGGTARVQFSLLTQPTAGASVTIPLSISNTAEGTIAVTSITILNANWNSPALNEVVITGADDIIADGTVAYTLVTGDPTSADASYNALTATDPADPTINNFDNDVAGVTIVESAGTTNVTEGGATDTYTVVLNTQPTANVVVTIGAGTQVTTSPTPSLTFTTANWNTAQTVTVTAVNDSVVEGAHTQAVSHTSTSADLGYQGLTITSVTANITDNDTAGYTVTPLTRTVAENGGTNTYTVVLTAQPLTNVVISNTSSATGEVTVSPATLTFTNGNWNVAQTVTLTGVNDNVDTATNDTANITVSVVDASSDNAWDPLADQTVVVTATDDDTAGVTPGPGITILETGTGAVSAVLNSQPASNVVLDVVSSDTGAATVSPSTLTFTPANWNITQNVTVTAVADTDILNENVTVTFTVNDALSSNEYDPVTDATEAVTVTDTNVASFSLSKSTSTIAENGGVDTFTVVLGAQPTSNVVLSVISSATSEATVSPATLTFTNANWNTAQTVTITGVNDNIDTVTNDTANIMVSVVDASSDNAWDPLADQTVVVTATDDDTAGVTTGAGITITETTNGTISVVLNSQPVSNVVLDITSSDTGAATVSPAQMTFTTVNWNTAQNVTVTGVADVDFANENVTVTVTVNDALSSNEYDPVTDKTEAVTVTDTNVAGFTLSATTLSFAETGTGAFTVVLTGQPISNVVFNVSSVNTGNATVAPSTLTFTNANWNTPQTVTATGVHNTVSLVNTSSNITVAVNTGSSDASFAAVSSQTVSATTTDIDDIDQDGNSNAIEDAGFNGGDGNGDGIQDSTQASVAGAPNSLAGGAYTTIQATGGCNVVAAFNVFSESSRPTQDSTSDYPLGLNNFRLACGSNGQSGTVTIFYDRVYDTSNWTWKKYNSVTNIYTDVTALVSSTIAQQTVGATPVIKVTFTVTDGGAGDEDGLANSTIIDPIGPAIPVVVASVSTNSGHTSGGSVRYCTDTIKTFCRAREVTTVTAMPASINPKTSPDKVCTPLIITKENVVLGKNNSVEEVKKIETFLNESEGEKLEVNGIYEVEDVAAVKRFQQKYFAEIITPFGGKAPTGIVGQFTRGKINVLNCGKTLGCPYFSTNQKVESTGGDVKRIQNFLNTLTGSTLVESGTFDQSTLIAVKKYQTLYKEVVLKPLNLKSATGLWYEKSRLAGNKLMGCAQ